MKRCAFLCVLFVTCQEILFCVAYCVLITLRRHTHTHTFNNPFSGTAWVSQYQKGQTSLDFTEARDSEWQWHQLGQYASLHLVAER